jgi:hypothetical protein
VEIANRDLQVISNRSLQLGSRYIELVCHPSLLTVLTRDPTVQSMLSD